MTERNWNRDSARAGVTAAESWSSPSLISLTSLRSEFRRRRRLWLGLAIIGAFLGVLATLLLPAKVSAASMLLLAHDPNTDAAVAAQTDIGLLDTDVVAQRVIAELGLPMTTTAFRKTVTVTSVSGQLLSISVTAPDAATAVARTAALARSYLAVRTDELTQQNAAIVQGLQGQIQDLTSHVTALTEQIDALQKPGAGPDPAALSDLISQRANVQSQISQLNQTLQTDQLNLAAVVDGSHVIDPAAVLPAHAARRMAINVASGLVLGLTVGLGIVGVGAVLSDRPRRRSDIAAATGVPVAMSVGRIRGRSKRGLRNRLLLAIRLADLMMSSHGERLALLGVSNERDLTEAAVTLVRELSVRGTVRVVDLTQSGGVERRLRAESGHDVEPPQRAAENRSQIDVVRLSPSALSRLSPPDRIPEAMPDDSGHSRWSGPAGFTLVVAGLDPAVGVEDLPTLADRALLLLTAGMASAERLSSTVGLIRLAGLGIDHVVLVGSDSTDESLGFPALEDVLGAPKLESRAYEQ